MVDLAGSELYGTAEQRETCFINSSLSALTKVLHSLAVKQPVPFRDATLTRMLQASLG
jgi:hypothetical protein